MRNLYLQIDVCEVPGYFQGCFNDFSDVSEESDVIEGFKGILVILVMFSKESVPLK